MKAFVSLLNALAQQRRGNLISLRFTDCKFDRSAIEAIRWMLKHDILEALSFSNCDLHHCPGATIQAELDSNRSLRVFACPLSFMTSVREQVIHNHLMTL
jgi:hypothetical protein